MNRSIILAYYFLALALVASSCSHKRHPEDFKVFKYNQAEGLFSLDPAFARNQANIWAVNQLYNGLVELNEEMEPVPCLSDGWEISEDGLTYLIKIKKGIFFHDNKCFDGGKGRELKATDFVYSFYRIVDPATKSPGFWIFGEKVLKNHLGKVSDTAFKAVDDYTLKIELSQPFPPFIKILAMPYAYVVPQEAVKMYKDDLRANPVGTGPFVFNHWDEGSSLSFLKNKNYWRKDEKGVQLPYMDAVEITFIADPNLAYLNFTQGKLDFISGINDNSKEEVFDDHGGINRAFLEKFKVQKSLYLNTEYVGIQLDKKFYNEENHPLLDPRVRKAMSYAIDRENLIAYIRNNLGTPGNSGFIPYAMELGKGKVKGYSFNMQKAIDLLKEAGYDKTHAMKPIRFNVKASDKSLAEFLQKEWQKVGIPIEIEVNESATLLRLIDNGESVLFRASWVGDYPDPENYMALFYSKNFTPDGPNKTHYKNKIFDEMYDRALQLQTHEERYDIYKQMDQMVMEDCPVIVLYYDEVIRLLHKDVKGLRNDEMNNLFLEKVYFEDSAE